MAPAFKLTYFPVKALAEPARFIMKYAGIEFEDARFERENWPDIKPKMPFGQVPVLEANGKVYHQSMAITRFLAKRAKLNGNTDWEDLEIDMVVDTINDLRLKIAIYSYEPDAAIKESRKGPLFDETIPYYLDRLDKIAGENGGHFACKRLTWADFYFVALLDYLNYMTGMDLTGKHPNLANVKTAVQSIPAIKEWINTRPKTDL